MNLYLCRGDFAMGDDMELSKIYPGNLGHDVFVIKENLYLGAFLSSSLKIAMISYRLVFIVPSVM
jgi:hypothetical protein